MTTQQNPMVENHRILKGRYPHALILHRIGDFYETYGIDAIDLSKICDITLVTREVAGITYELAGFPSHAINKFLLELNKSRSVLIAEYEPKIEEATEQPEKPEINKQPIFTLVQIVTDEENLWEQHAMFLDIESARTKMRKWIVNFAQEHLSWYLDENNQDLMTFSGDDGQRAEIYIVEDQLED